MKKILLLCLSIIQFNAVRSQTITEKKVIYSVPGTDNKLTSFLGVPALGGSRFNDDYPAVVEVVDMKDNGFIIRDKLKILYFDNQLNKISENDLSGFYDKKNGLIEFFPVANGVWIKQEDKLAFLNKEGTFTIKPAQDFIKTVDSFQPPYTKESEASIIDYYYISSSQKQYFLRLELSKGKVNVLLTELSEKGNKVIRTFEVAVPVNPIKEGALQRLNEREQPNLYVDEEKNDVFIFFNIQDYGFHGFLSIKSPSAGLASFQYLTETTLPPYHLEKRDFALFTLNQQKMCPSDAAIYMGYYYPVLNFHSRAFEVFVPSNFGPQTKIHGHTSVSHFTPRESAGQSTQNLNNTIQLTIGEKGEIIKAEKLHCTKPPVKHKDLIVMPNERTTLYRSKDYKPQEMDLIYESDAKSDPGANLFSILRRKDFSYIINFREKNSEVEVWKVKF